MMINGEHCECRNCSTHVRRGHSEAAVVNASIIHGTSRACTFALKLITTNDSGGLDHRSAGFFRGDGALFRWFC